MGVRYVPFLGLAKPTGANPVVQTDRLSRVALGENIIEAATLLGAKQGQTSMLCRRRSRSNLLCMKMSASTVRGGELFQDGLVLRPTRCLPAISLLSTLPPND